jgi:hypothetical protein
MTSGTGSYPACPHAGPASRAESVTAIEWNGHPAELCSSARRPCSVSRGSADTRWRATPRPGMASRILAHVPENFALMGEDSAHSREPSRPRRTRPPLQGRYRRTRSPQAALPCLRSARHCPHLLALRASRPCVAAAVSVVTTGETSDTCVPGPTCRAVASEGT